MFSNGYLDDQWVKLSSVLSRLEEAGMRLDQRKCDFATKVTKSLGFIVKAGVGIKMDAEIVKAISTWDPSEEVKGVRKFLGFANFYRNFINKFTCHISPLQLHVTKKIPFRRSNEQQTAIENLIQLFSTVPVLAM